MREDFLFVYGTLRQQSDAEIARLFFQHARDLGPARFQGKLYLISTYPAAIASDHAEDQICGQLIALPVDDALWRALDDYEGIGLNFPEPYEYKRCRMPVNLEDGSRIDAWLYLYQHDLSRYPRIARGDYFKFLESERLLSLGLQTLG